MHDLTVLYITANEMPEKWMEYQIDILLKAIGDTPIISVSRKPMDLGVNLLDTEPEKSYWNIYKQMLRAAWRAKTCFVAMVEDDVLYSKEHFVQFRPKRGEVSYNRSRWSLFAWDPIYCLRQRVSNCSLIACRKVLIEALTEREEKYPDGNKYVGEIGRAIVENRLGVSRRKMVEWYSTVPIIHINHPGGIDETQQQQWKKHGQIKAIDIPFWGKAKDIVEVYNGSQASK